MRKVPFLFAIALAVCLIPVVAFADDSGALQPAEAADSLEVQADNIAEGIWGTCPWEISADGTLTVHPGEGQDIKVDYSPWKEYDSQIKVVVFSSEGGRWVIAPKTCPYLLGWLKNVTSADLSGLDTSYMTNMGGMFMGCQSLRTIFVGEKWGLYKTPINGENMFEGCVSLVGGNGTGYDTSHEDAEYARVDAPGTPGYFTLKGGSKAESTLMHRLYNPNSGEHFYTGDGAEKDYLAEIGWQYEGVGWTAPTTSDRPVYRLYNRSAGDHHYTLDAEEREYLIGIGWEDEDIGWYSAGEDGTPLYRQYNPNATGAGSHNYTADINERDFLVNNGWNDEGIGWYGIGEAADDAGGQEDVSDKYVFTGTVRVATDAELMGEMNESYKSFGTSDMRAVLMFDEPQSVEAPQMGMSDPVTHMAESVALDYSTWQGRAGERVTLVFDSVHYPGGVMYAWLFSDSEPREIS